ncbi:DUF3261 domain-containing protein [Telluria aromaticivorans]|uniref:DUF3261 domain-containing protein n=1 Tax=Telluria aromaticivorans TaxID=2725995 RepID=A0A7Y2NYC9_9BURK|nr:DUF3261 domain-containing protein [Telluria aromaticivorans]NNG21864.1 DUF3261 domain-containing protein [Telluria aromaticivorans]
MRCLSWLERAVPLALALMLGACAPDEPAPARLGLRLAPAALGASISVQQHLTVERAGKTNDLDAALEVDGSRVSLVGLAMGMRVLSLDFDGRELREWRHPMLPSQVRAADVLEDLQLTLWPVAEIARVLPAGWKVEDKGLRRTLRREGEVVATIDYSGTPRWRGTAVLDNLRYKYKLTIVSATN